MYVKIIQVRGTYVEINLVHVTYVEIIEGSFGRLPNIFFCTVRRKFRRYLPRCTVAVKKNTLFGGSRFFHFSPSKPSKIVLDGTIHGLVAMLLLDILM